MSENQPAVRDAKPLFALLLGLILFLFGIAVGYMVGGKSAATPGGRGYDEGYAAAKAELQQKLVDKGLALSPDELDNMEQQPVYNVTGTITEIGASSLKMTATFIAPDILSEPTTVEMVVNVTNDTKIIRQLEKTPEEFQKDLEAYDQAISSAAAEGTEPSPGGEPELAPPGPYKSEEISLPDLEVGMTVSVSSGDNMRGKTAVDATEISHFETAATPGGELLGPPQEGAPPESTLVPPDVTAPDFVGPETSPEPPLEPPLLP